MDDSTIIHQLCHKNDMANNSMKEFEIKLDELNDPNAAKDQNNNTNVHKVLLVKENDEFYCIGSKCTHYGVPLVNGYLHNGRLRCFAHGACFDIKTGDIEDYPGPDCLPKYNIYIDEQTGYVILNTTKKELESKKRVRKNLPEPKKTSASRPVSAATNNNSVNLNISGSRPSSSNPVSAVVTRIGSPRTMPENAVNNSLTRVLSNKMFPKCLIIGTGAAGLLCMETLREAGYGPNIYLITKDSYPPYDRPKLSKALDTKIQSIIIRDEEFFRENNINLFLNQEVEKIEFDKRQVHCQSGRTFDYDKLIIATGMTAIKPDVKINGSHLTGIFTLRTYDDAAACVKHFNSLHEDYIQKLSSERKLNVAIVGGSFIAMEVASYFANKANVLMMSRGKPFESIFGTKVSEKILRLHKLNGVHFLIQQKFDIAEFKESKEIQGHLGFVKLNDGTKWPADICIMAIGGKPVTHFLKNSPLRLTLENYVMVDKYMRTNVENVYAVGDITVFPRACLPGFEFTLSKHNAKLDNVNISHWGLASSHGRTAALSIIGIDQPLKVLPFFWSTQFNKAIRFSGFNHSYDSVVFHEDPTKSNELKFAAFYLLTNRVVGVCTLDWDPICAAYAEAMYNNIEINREHVDPNPTGFLELLQKPHNLI